MRNLAKQALPQRLYVECDRLIAHHNWQRAGDPRKVCSTKTQNDRRLALLQAYGQLWEEGFHLQHPDGIRAKHVVALMARWDREGLSAGTLQTRLSYLRTLAGWLGKPQIVGDLVDYLPKERWTRSAIAKENKAWVANGVEPETVIKQAVDLDPALAAMLRMQYAFGLRVKEAIEVRPEHILRYDGEQIEVFDGTKGGRPRFIKIETDEQRQALQFACAVASRHRGGRLRWPGLTWTQARNRYYHMVRRKLGVSKAELGVTSHGMRHGFAHTEYHRATGGLPTPIEGGALGRIDRAMHARASMHVSRSMGHLRIDVSASYYGSYGHGLRNAPAVVKVAPFRWV